MNRKGHGLLVWGLILLAFLTWGAPAIALADGTVNDPPIEPPTPPPPDPTPPAPDNDSGNLTADYTLMDAVWVVVDLMI